MNSLLAPTFSSSADSPLPALFDFHLREVKTYLSLFVNLVHPLTLLSPGQFFFFFFPALSAQVLLYEAQPTLPATSSPATLQNKSSPPFALRRSPFSFSLHRFPISVLSPFLPGPLLVVCLHSLSYPPHSKGSLILPLSTMALGIPLQFCPFYLIQ